MSGTQLVLKRPTGWFAAGWQFGQALGELSDAAFKLYAWLCLNADRRTGHLHSTGTARNTPTQPDTECRFPTAVWPLSP